MRKWKLNRRLLAAPLVLGGALALSACYISEPPYGNVSPDGFLAKVDITVPLSRVMVAVLANCDKLNGGYGFTCAQGDYEQGVKGDAVGDEAVEDCNPYIQAYPCVNGTGGDQLYNALMFDAWDGKGNDCLAFTVQPYPRAFVRNGNLGFDGWGDDAVVFGQSCIY